MEEIKESCALCGAIKSKQQYKLVLALSDISDGRWLVCKILDHGPVPVDACEASDVLSVMASEFEKVS